MGREQAKLQDETQPFRRADHTSKFMFGFVFGFYIHNDSPFHVALGAPRRVADSCIVHEGG